ncbi:trigger factor [Longilinea arvoryzae]|uniref:Trigger factor n=1 Tax=Longilinea arvoryzae TaxID=360412 RepID=A0A0S7BID2_9CHLR|nr:trigger factor [Longilinea arvoryzae]GAP14852.1 trigger factor [Longilinea arvoryzae]
MKIETQPREDHQVKIIAEFDAETMEGFKRRAARKISQETRIPGFRPGKAPYDIVRRTYGDDAIQKQAIEILVDDQYSKILDEAGVKPGAPGALEDILSTDPVKLSFIVPLAPEVTLGDYKAIRKEYEAPAVTEEQIDEYLRRLQTSYATAEPVEHPAEKGDLVYYMLSGHLTQPAEGEDAEVIKDGPAQVIIGEDTLSDKDWPYAGFAEELIGLSANAEKTVKHTFAEDDKDEKLRGREVEFHITVQSIKSLHLPELNDEFAQTMGEFSTFEELKASAVKQLEANTKHEYDEKFFDELFEQIASESTIKYPPQVLEDEKEHILEHLTEDLSKNNLDLDTYLKLINTNRETFMAEQVTPAAVKRLTRSLVLEELGRAEKIELAEAEVNNAVNGTLNQLSATPGFNPKKVTERVVNAIAMDAVSRLYNQRILDRLKAIATGEAEKAAAEPKAEAAAESATEAGEKAPGGESEPAENDAVK